MKSRCLLAIHQHDLPDGAQHYRSIHFPASGGSPRFIWLLMDGSRGGHRVNDADLSQHVSGSRYGGITVSSHHRLGRDYKNFMVVEHDQNMFVNRQLPNQCLEDMISPIAQRWQGDYVAHAYKYLYSNSDDDFDAEDRELGGIDFPLIALDLDTTSLGPLIAYLTWYAQNRHSRYGF